jgi:hypothetical protein
MSSNTTKTIGALILGGLIGYSLHSREMEAQEALQKPRVEHKSSEAIEKERAKTRKAYEDFEAARAEEAKKRTAQLREDRFAEFADELLRALQGHQRDWRIETIVSEKLLSAHLIYTNRNGSGGLAVSLAGPEEIEKYSKGDAELQEQASSARYFTVLLEPLVSTRNGLMFSNGEVELVVVNSLDKLEEKLDDAATEIEPPTREQTENDY